MLQASVIIPTHNRPQYLKEALQSVVSQEGVELDVIVVGDGAGEDTAAVVAGFPGVRYVRQAQSGPNVARNRAVALARFDCVAMLDDDDLWLPSKLRTQLEILAREPEAAYLFSDFQILRPGRPPLPQGLSTWGIPAEQWQALLTEVGGEIPGPGLTPQNGGSMRYYRVDLYRAMLEHPYVLPTTAVFRKSFLTPDIRFVEDDFICGDWEFFARLSRSHKAIYMPVETACNRSHEGDGRLTRTPDHVQLQCRLRMVDSLWAGDRDFLSNPGNKALLDGTRHGYLLSLAKLQLREGHGDAALETLEHARAIVPALPLPLKLAAAIARMPGGLGLLRGTDRLLCSLRGLAQRR